MNQAIKDLCRSPSDAERGKIEQRSVVPFVSEATNYSTEKDKGKYIEITCSHNPQKRIPRKTIIMFIFEFCIMVPQKTCSCSTPRFRMSFSRNPVMTQSPGLTSLSSYYPDKPRGIFSRSRLRFLTQKSLVRVQPLLPNVESWRTPSRKS